MCVGIGVSDVPGMPGAVLYCAACPGESESHTPEQRAAHVLLYYSARLRRYVCRAAGVRQPDSIIVESGIGSPVRSPSGRPAVHVGADYVLGVARTVCR